MKKNFSWIKNIIILSLFSSYVFADGKADLAILTNAAGFYMGPNATAEIPIHPNWESMIKLMKEVASFDAIVDQISASLCNPNKNKSVLLVGSAEETYQYIFARFAARKNDSNCQDLDHLELDLNRLIAGHNQPGEIEEFWQNKILKAAEFKDLVLYVSNLGRMMGMGASGNSQVGIEAQYAANISSGQLRSVAFITNYEYNQLVFGGHAFVLNSFAKVIHLDQMTAQDVRDLMQRYLKILYPRMTLATAESKYLSSAIEFYWPNIGEPQRSLAVLKDLIRKIGSGVSQTLYPSLVETAHPYAASSDISFTLDYPSEHQLQLNFEIFATENKFDQLQVIDGFTNKILETFSGNIGAFKTQIYPTNKLILKFTSDPSTQRYGFKIKEVIGLKMGESSHAFSFDEIRRSILELSQVPKWLMDRDFTVIKNLEKKLEDSVVGVGEAKKQIVNMAKIGYVAGRTDNKPIGSLLLTGPTGTGKSFIAKKLAEFLQFELITLDMTQFRTEESLDRFVEVMSAHLVTNPYAIYLFEEIDKAELKVLDRLYFMMDEGIFYDKFQRPLFARGAFVLMTTNAAQNIILDHATDPNLRKLVYQELLNVFRPSFVNRFDGISIFKPFSESEFALLAKILTQKKIDQLSSLYQWTLTVDQNILDYVALKGQSALFGARPMERLVENLISLGISEYQFQAAPLPNGAKFKIVKGSKENQFLFSLEGRSEVVSYEIDPDLNSGKRGPRIKFKEDR